MPDLIVYIDSSRIHEGRLEDVKTQMAELAEFVEAHEPQLIAYSFFLNDEQNRMTTFAIHPNSDSMEFHMDVAGAEFRKFAGLITLSSIEVYGEASDAVVQKLREKAEMLGAGPSSVTVHRMHAGFIRLRTE